MNNPHSANAPIFLIYIEIFPMLYLSASDSFVESFLVAHLEDDTINRAFIGNCGIWESSVCPQQEYLGVYGIF